MLKQYEALDLSLRDMLNLFRRCEEIASTIRRGRAKAGKYGTAEALVKQTSEFVAEIERLRAKTSSALVAADSTPKEQP